MYKNIIFDLGNVLIDFNPKAHLRDKINNPQKEIELYKEIYQSEEWLMLDRGIITEEEGIRSMIGKSNGNGDLIKLAFINWYEILTPIECTIEILKELKNSGYNLYFLSNYPLLPFEYVSSRYDFFKLFDGGVVSHMEGTIKPEVEIYCKLTERYDLKPEESIFIDDSIDNINAAKKLNFNTIIFISAIDLVEKLKAYNIYI